MLVGLDCCFDVVGDGFMPWLQRCCHEVLRDWLHDDEIIGGVCECQLLNYQWRLRQN